MGIIVCGREYNPKKKTLREIFSQFIKLQNYLIHFLLTLRVKGFSFRKLFAIAG